MIAETKDELDRYQSARRRAVAGIIILLLLLFLFVGSSLPNPAHENVELAGIALIVTGILGRMWSTLYVGGRKASELVQVGPYSVTRNPLYLFSTIAAAGVGAQMGSVTAAILFAVICAAAFHFVILREERYLHETFGSAYEAYRKRVPRFLPAPVLYRDQETVTFRPARLKGTLVDGLVFFVALPVFELIEALQASGWLVTLLHLP